MYLLRKIKFALFVGGILLLASGNTFAQEQPTAAQIPMPQLGPNDTIPVPAQVHDGQMVPVGNLEWIYVSARYPKHLLKRRQEWTRLRNAVYVTYPYARKAAFIINDINTKLASMPSKGERKKFIKS